MSKTYRPRTILFAIVRVDAFQLGEVEDTITITKVVHTQAEAIAEVARLNALAQGKGSRYWWQQTKLYDPPAPPMHHDDA